MSLTRRRFVQTGSLGVTVPAFLWGCGGKTTQQSLITPASAVAPADPFARWFGIDASRAQRVMAELSRHGADLADLYFQHRRRDDITLEEGRVSKASSTVDLGVGLRVVLGDKVGFAFSEDLSQSAMLSAARSAATVAGRGTSNGSPVAFIATQTPSFYRIEVPWEAIGLPDKIALLQRLEGYAKAADTRVEQVKAYITSHEERVLIATLDGKLIADERPLTSVHVTVTLVRGGQRETATASLAARHGVAGYDEASLQRVAHEAVERAAILFEAVQPPAGEMPVVLAAGASGILLHEAIGHGLEADFNRKSISIYADKLGQPIAPEFVTIIDDATLDGASGALNTDDEGITGERTVLVERGRLVSYLFDQHSARYYEGRNSTGSGRRESFRHPPMPRMRCTSMLDGPHTRDEIIAAVDKGIIAETYTNGQVNIGVGDFTFYVRNGWLIEKGKLTAPIRDCNIIGNGPEALQRVKMAAADSTLDTGGWNCGKDGQNVPVSQGIPTVLVDRLTVGGRNA